MTDEGKNCTKNSSLPFISSLNFYGFQLVSKYEFYASCEFEVMTAVTLYEIFMIETY